LGPLTPQPNALLKRKRQTAQDIEDIEPVFKDIDLINDYFQVAQVCNTLTSTKKEIEMAISKEVLMKFDVLKGNIDQIKKRQSLSLDREIIAINRLDVVETAVTNLNEKIDQIKKRQSLSLKERRGMLYREIIAINRLDVVETAVTNLNEKYEGLQDQINVASSCLQKLLAEQNASDDKPVSFRSVWIPREWLKLGLSYPTKPEHDHGFTGGFVEVREIDSF
jgi:chromosome segregation ATPase